MFIGFMILILITFIIGYSCLFTSSKADMDAEKEYQELVLKHRSHIKD